MIIVDECPFDILLGLDFLEAFKFTLDLEHRVLTSKICGIIPFSSQSSNFLQRIGYNQRHLCNPPIPTQNQHPQPNHIPVFKLRIMETVTIPARSRTLVSVFHTLVQPTPAEVTPCERIYNKTNLLIPAMLIDHTTSAIMIINPTLEDQTLQTQTVVGKIQPYAPIQTNVNLIQQITNPNQAETNQININPDIPPIYQAKIRQLIRKYEKIFSWNDFILGKTSRLKFNIDTGDAEPIKMRPFPTSEAQKAEIQRHIDFMLEHNIIEESNSPWAAPCCLVPKKDAEGNYTAKRFIVDFRGLNSVTKKFSWPLPRTEDVLNSLRNSQYFSTMDLSSGYWQVEMEAKDKEKTAFTTHDALYQFNVLAFGLCNAPSHFAKLMHVVLSGLTNETCLCFVDDTIVYSNTLDDHLIKLERVFARFLSEGLTLKPSKCNFMFQELKVLGFIVSKEGVKLDPKQVEAVTNLPIPTTTKKVQKMLGLFSYYRKYIKNFSQIAQPLSKLLVKDQQFEWTSEQDQSFQQLKEAITTAPILCLFDPTKETILRPDASTFGIGSTLSQIHNGEEKPVAYISRNLSPAERNYITTEQELLAIVWSIKRLKQYLYGKTFKIYTDHHALCWILRAKKQEMTPKLMRMSLVLSEYDIEGIHHVSGKKHVVADCLSRFPIDPPDDLDEIEVPILSIGINNMSSAQHQDPSIIDIIQQIQQQNPAYTQRFTTIDGILYYQCPTSGKSLVVIPKHLQQSVLIECHDNPISAHLGFNKTLDRVSKRYYWKKLRSDVKQYVKTCSECQTRKIPRLKPAGKMQFFQIPEIPFENVQIDVMGPFTRTTKGNKYVVTAIDYLTKWIEARAIKESTTDQIALFVIEQIICRHGCPKSIQSDRGTIFTSDLFQKISQFLGINHHVSTAYHPQSQGLVEKSHSTLTDCISMYVSTNQKDWDIFLPHIVFSLNSSEQATTKFSPFFLLYGRDAIFPIESTIPSQEHATLNDIIDHVQQARIIAKDNIHKAQQQYAKYVDEKHRTATYNIGDQVLLRRHVIKKGLSSKLFHHFFGPYTVIDQTSNVNYVIEAKRRGKTYIETVHIDKLKPYYERVDAETTTQLDSKHPSQPEDNPVDPHEHTSTPITTSSRDDHTTDQDTNDKQLLPTKSYRDALVALSEAELPIQQQRYNLRTRKPVNYKE